MSNATLPLCQCGCGKVVTETYKRTRSALGHVKGEYHPFLPSHQHPSRQMTLEEKFWANVDRRGPDECWEWTGGKISAGYGHLIISKAEGSHRAHRYSYELLVGPIPDGLEIDHLCENRACVNPAHLEAVTHQTNMVRASTSLVGINARKTHCPRGHEYSPGNTYVQPNGGRRCRECARIVKRAWTARKIAEAS